MTRSRKLMMIAILVALGAAALWSSLALSADHPGIRFARHPALSPDGRTLAFSYHGDIWTVPVEGGTAQRLTVHAAFEQFPVWSPDGRWIAFASNRAGDYDVWAMPASGGEPVRLTYHSAPDYPTDWSRDGKEILFTSSRETTRTAAIYAVNVHTGRSRLIRADDFALANARFTLDGKNVICTRGGSWTRRLYRGSGASDLLIVPATGGAGRYLTRTEVNERWAAPMPDGKTICYVTDASGAPNLVRRGISGGREQPLTRFRDGSLYYPSVALDGSRIVFERGFGLWVLDTRSLAVHELHIEAPGDLRTNPEARYRFSNRVQEYAVAPDGKRIAFVVHGEIFLQTPGATEPERLADTPQREEDVAWSPDAKSLAFVSDRTGEAELYVMDVQTRTVKQLTSAPGLPPAAPSFSPDGRTVAFVRGASEAELCLVPSAGGDVRVLVRDPSISGVRWSPDGKWLAYARTKSHSAGTLADIFIIAPETPKPINVTRYPVVNTAPAWAPDGSRLFFISNRTQTPHVWSVSLRDTGGPSGDDAEGRDASGPDFELKRVHLRARRVTIGDSPVRNYALTPDGKSLLFSTPQLDGTDIWRVPTAGGAATRLTRSGEAATSLQFAKDGTALFYQTGGAVKRLVLSGPEPVVQPVALNAEMSVNRQLELLQMFDEAWRKMRDGFYDPRMHGCDWQDVRRRYRPVVGQLETKEEFYALFSLALGELNASHCGISGPSEAPRPATACLGVVLDDTYQGRGVRVAQVVPRSPAAQSRSRLEPGDILLRLNDAEIRTNEAFYGLLEDTERKTITLHVKGRDGKERDLRIRPISATALRQLTYDEWVQQREQIVERLSQGRLLYVHLSAMGPEQLERFRRAVLGDAEGRDGVVLDLRFNGGGSIADEMFSVIQNRVFGWRTIRDDPAYSPAPLPVLSKPIIVLINQASLSNAEVFPWGFRALKLGTLVGTRTYGGVIGTGSTTLIDGSTLRMPAVGSYTLDQHNMENNGCPPDIRVENTPEDIVAGRDRQLERAVAELLKQVLRRSR